MRTSLSVVLPALFVSAAACGGKAVTYGPGSSGGASGDSGGGNDTGNGGGATQGTRTTNASSTRGDDDAASSAVVVTTGRGTTITTTGGTTGSTTGGYIATVLQPQNGWVSAADNTAEIQGAFWTASDNDSGGTAFISPTSFEMAGNSICVSGTAEQVLNGEYGVYWGALLGLNLNQAEGEEPAEPYDALAQGVTGIGFSISALPIGGQLRFGVHVSGETNDYCKTITALTSEFRWDDLQRNCWAAEPETPDPTRLEAIYWQIVTNESAAYDFDFCIRNLVALTN